MNINEYRCRSAAQADTLALLLLMRPKETNECKGRIEMEGDNDKSDGENGKSAGQRKQSINYPRSGLWFIHGS